MELIGPPNIAGGDHGSLAGLADDDHPQYQEEDEKGVAGGYASLDGSGTVPDAQLPAALARDAEVTAAVSAAVSAHEGAADPHAGYVLNAELTAHEGAADPHAGYVLNAELAAHESASPAHAASAVSIVDAGLYYTSTDVEGALQEIGAGGIGGGSGGVGDTLALYVFTR